MRQYIIDIETIPLPEEELLKMMPPALANPIMPEEIKNPVMPEELVNPGIVVGLNLTPKPEDFMDGCPAYITKAHPEGDQAKKLEYGKKGMVKYIATQEEQVRKRTQKREDWIQKSEDRKNAWEEKQIETKQRFVDDAALSATTGSVKLIGIKDYAAGKVYILIAEPTVQEMEKLNKATYPLPISFIPWNTEAGILSAFSKGVNNGNVISANEDAQSDFRLIGFYTNYFDFPFLFRRSWITGATAPVSLRKGRYFNDSISTDLLDLWQLGDRQEKVGGMDGLAKILGTKRKTGTGEGFHRLWSEDPVSAVLYLLDDLKIVEEAAEKMGVFCKPSPPKFPS